MTEALESTGASNYSKWTLWLAIAATLIFLLAPLGNRLGIYDFMLAFGIWRVVFFVCIAVALAALVLLVMAIAKRRRRDILATAHALPIALVPVGILLYQFSVATSLPQIHDISTDLLDPPALTATDGMPERSLVLATNEVRDQQRQAYADVVPIELTLGAQPAFAKVIDTAQKLGWQIVYQNADQGVLQAVDTTLWFGFKDDIAVRLQPAGAGTRVDVRSVSRVGLSDIGKNAARIRAFRQHLTGR